MPNPLDGLNQQQLEAVEHQNGPLCVFAGPGSGKTRVLICRIARLIQTGVKPENIMAVTFTRKAAGELKRRLNEMVGNSAVYANTFHAFCRATLKRHYSLIGGDKNFEVADEEMQDQLLTNLPDCDKLKIQKYKLRDPNAVEAHPAWLQECYEPYESALKERNMLDFADLLAKTVQLFEECPDLLANARDALRYIHVDEYQDTNYLQGKLANMLAGPRGNICVVGDDDQSIYGFHGAHPDNIRKFTEQYPSAETVTLEQNYRSTKTILKKAVSVIENNNNRVPKYLFTRNKQGGQIRIMHSQNRWEEAAKIAKSIQTLMTKWNGLQYRNIAVLYRNGWVAKELKKKLTARHIRFTSKAGALGQKELLGDAGDGDDPNAVALSTIHGAKGLEFKIVFLIGLENDIIPDRRCSREEERRLFYVGMTRAEQLLYLSYAEQPSKFLMEQPFNLQT